MVEIMTTIALLCSNYGVDLVKQEKCQRAWFTCVDDNISKTKDTMMYTCAHQIIGTNAKGK